MVILLNVSSHEDKFKVKMEVANPSFYKPLNSMMILPEEKNLEATEIRQETMKYIYALVIIKENSDPRQSNLKQGYSNVTEHSQCVDVGFSSECLIVEFVENF